MTTLLGAAVAVGAGLTVPGSAAPPRSGAPVSVPVRTISPAPSATPTPSGDGPGIAISARPDADGSFLVTELVTLPSAATEVRLRPPSIGGAGRGFERLRPAAVDVQVMAGGQAVAMPDGPVRGEVALGWAAPTSSLELRYRLTQVSVTSTYAKAGRSVAAFGSLVGQLPADFPVTVEVTGRTVLSLTCPQLPLDQLACGAGAAPRFWTLRPIPFDRSLVLVPYDRPAPG